MTHKGEEHWAVFKHTSYQSSNQEAETASFVEKANENGKKFLLATLSGRDTVLPKVVELVLELKINPILIFTDCEEKIALFKEKAGDFKALAWHVSNNYDLEIIVRNDSQELYRIPSTLNKEELTLDASLLKEGNLTHGEVISQLRDTIIKYRSEKHISKLKSLDNAYYSNVVRLYRDIAVSPYFSIQNITRQHPKICATMAKSLAGLLFLDFKSISAIVVSSPAAEKFASHILNFYEDKNNGLEIEILVISNFGTRFADFTKNSVPRGKVLILSEACCTGRHLVKMRNLFLAHSRVHSRNDCVLASIIKVTGTQNISMPKYWVIEQKSNFYQPDSIKCQYTERSHGYSYSIQKENNELDGNTMKFIKEMARHNFVKFNHKGKNAVYGVYFDLPALFRENNDSLLSEICGNFEKAVTSGPIIICMSENAALLARKITHEKSTTVYNYWEHQVDTDNEELPFHNKNVILVDDCLNSGNTINEAFLKLALVTTICDVYVVLDRGDDTAIYPASKFHSFARLPVNREYGVTDAAS